ncbi:MAG: hypothetical protein ABI809_14545 [Caldimonas sp.]
MTEFKKPPIEPRKVWRITSTAPQGEFVTVGATTSSSTAANVPALHEHGDDLSVRRKAVRYWRASSYDLLTGLDVKDFSDTVPNEILDELFKP